MIPFRRLHQLRIIYKGAVHGAALCGVRSGGGRGAGRTVAGMDEESGVAFVSLRWLDGKRSPRGEGPRTENGRGTWPRQRREDPSGKVKPNSVMHILHMNVLELPYVQTYSIE